MRAPHPARRDGYVAVAVAVSLVTLLSFVALTLDGGLLLDHRRQVQAAADAAALAAAGDLYYNWMVEAGKDPNKTAYNAALAAAKENGFENGVNNCKVDVLIPPTSGPFKDQLGHAEVKITFQQPRYFSKIFGSDATVPVYARAVGRGRNTTTRNSILCLDPNDKGALTTGGNGAILVNNAPIQINSNNIEAAIANGGGSMVQYQLDITGGYSTPGGGSFVGPLNTGTEPIPDPLAHMIPPDPRGLTVRSTKKINHSGANTLKLQPGVYQGGISISGKGNVELAPGIYYMDGGGFNWGGQGSLIGRGVMIYNNPQSNSDKIDVSGQGLGILTPMTTGPYQGILFWQRRDSDVPVNVTGQGNLTITGTFYAAGAHTKVTGNGLTDLVGSQYISKTLALGGNGTFSITWTGEDTPAVRHFLLVE